MKYSFIPENTQEAEALQNNPAVHPLFDPFVPVIQARVIMAAVKTGIFTQIGNESYSANSLTKTLNLSLPVLSGVLNILVDAGYLLYENNCYRLTELSKATMLPDQPQTLSTWVLYNYIQWEAISNLEASLQNNNTFNVNEHISKTNSWDILQNAMYETAKPAAEWIANTIPVAINAGLMLDIGGGHGWYSAALCRKHPPLRSEILDYPEVIKAGTKIAKQEKYDDVVFFTEGSIVENDIKNNNYDVVFVGNLLHHFPEKELSTIVYIIYRILKKNGTIAIWDFMSTENYGQHDVIRDCFNLFFTLTSSAKCHTITNYKQKLDNAGFVNINIHHGPSPSHILIIAIKDEKY